MKSPCLFVSFSLAKNIYTSDARFVFELLQNADDNRFTRASINNTLPFVSFQVFPDRIVVECNEDGFTKSDLSAVCAVGKSTKSVAHGYIGAKGIGFKSVFIAAWKVYIQSGYFSYCFKHEKGDLGLGMVVPVWQDTDDELPYPLTRMTLYLHEKGDPQDVEYSRQIIFKQLSGLQQICLLFLRNLKRIKVSFHNEDGELQSSNDFSVGDVHENSVVLHSELTDGCKDTIIKKQRYHVTRHMATGLSKSDNREPPTTDEAKRAASIAEVILAFPLTSDSEPVLEQQEIFAFLPVRESSFKVSMVKYAQKELVQIVCSLTSKYSSSYNLTSTQAPAGKISPRPREETMNFWTVSRQHLSKQSCNSVRIQNYATLGQAFCPHPRIAQAPSGQVWVTELGNSYVRLLY